MRLHVKLDDSGYIVSTSKGKNPTDDECAQLVADINYSMVEDLIRKLASARKSSGRKPEEVARILGVSEDFLNEVEKGEFDLSVDDLREYLYAIDAVGTFKIVPNARKAIYSGLLRSASAAGDHMWRESKPIGPDTRADRNKPIYLSKGWVGSHG